MSIYTLKMFYDFLVDEGIIAGNPVVTKRLTVVVEDRLPDFLTDEELDAVFNSETYKNLPYYVQLAMRTMLASGLRIGEVASLTPQDVIVRDGIVLLRVRAKNSKRRKERYVPVLDREVAKAVSGRPAGARTSCSAWERADWPTTSGWLNRRPV
jgi:site-specific recombinase XerD